MALRVVGWGWYQLSRNPGNGQATVKKRAEAPQKEKEKEEEDQKIYVEWNNFVGPHLALTSMLTLLVYLKAN